MQPFLYVLGLTLLAAIPPGRDNGHGHPRASEKSKWVILKTSTLDIAGHTNVSHFSCGVPQYTEPDTLTFLAEGSQGQIPGIPLTGTVRLSIDQFDCRSRMMTNEFKKALLSATYPKLSISFVNLERMPTFTTRPETIKGWVEIELAGTCKVFEINYTARRSDACAVALTGERALCFHDFGLEPPTKMGGLVKVNDTLHVHFTLCMRQVE
jgi:hypothetical protein